MSVWDRLAGRQNGHGAMALAEPAQMQPLTSEAERTIAHQSVQLDVLQERLLELENALEGWERIDQQGGQEFSREALDKITRQARLYAIKNPLIKRAVSVSCLYVWGGEVTVRAEHPDVDAVVQRFWDEPSNRSAMSSQQAMLDLEKELLVAGNLFFALFTDRQSGQVRVRTVLFEEIREVICSPDDRQEVWFYKRQWQETSTDLQTGQLRTEDRVVYYPDWRYNPGTRQPTIGGKPVEWLVPLYHLKVEGYPGWRFGVSDLYAALDWAKAYKEGLEDDATRSRALARFAWNLTTKGGAAGVAAAKAQLTTTRSLTAGSVESNPPPLVGSTFMGSGVSMDPVRIAGATLPADHHKPLRLMVAAAVGLPDTILSGDMDQGNLATARTLDRPTELKFTERRLLWRDVLFDLLGYAIDQAALAARGPIKGRLVTTDDGRQVVELELGDDGEPLDRHLDVDWPALTERSVTERVDAVVKAATLDGKLVAGTLPPELVSRLLLLALEVDDADDELAQMFPQDGDVAAGSVLVVAASERFTEALRDLKAYVSNGAA